ncbi:MAG: YqgE/AlgH family protein [Muribaculaceae bacterium]|nr:YqgE/AlgH family protein [Muribaculaceae bacterium]
MYKIRLLTIFVGEMEELNLDIFNLLDSQPVPSRVSLLVAKPTVEDFCFKRSVTVLVDHDEEGSMGVMVNKPTRFTLNEIMPDLECNAQIPLYLGGPVGTNQLFFVHTLGKEAIPDSEQLAPGLFFGGNFDLMKLFLANGHGINEKVKFMVGYSGWTSGQLDNEVNRHDWAVLKGDIAQLVMSDDNETIWHKAVERFGDQYRLWKAWPDDVSLN